MYLSTVLQSQMLMASRNTDPITLPYEFVSGRNLKISICPQVGVRLGTVQHVALTMSDSNTAKNTWNIVIPNDVTTYTEQVVINWATMTQSTLTYSTWTVELTFDITNGRISILPISASTTDSQFTGRWALPVLVNIYTVL